MGPSSSPSPPAPDRPPEPQPRPGALRDPMLLPARARRRPLPFLQAPARQNRAAGRRSRPRQTRAPIYSRGPGRRHLLLSLPRSGQRGLRGAGGRRAAGASPAPPGRARGSVDSFPQPTARRVWSAPSAPAAALASGPAARGGLPELEGKGGCGS